MGLTTYNILDTGLEVIPQSRTDSGLWNCTTGNAERLSIKAATDEKRRRSYPFPSRRAFSKGGLNGWQETENTDSQEDAREGGAIGHELHDAEGHTTLLHRKHTTHRLFVVVVGEKGRAFATEAPIYSTQLHNPCQENWLSTIIAPKCVY